MDDPTAPGLLDAVWRYRWMVAICGLVGLLLAAIVGAIFVPKASAEATIALKTPTSRSVIAPGLQGDASLARYTSQRALFATSDEVIEAAAAELTGWTPAQLANAVVATPSTNSTSFNIRVNAATPQQAVDAVDALVAAYTAQSLKQVQDATAAALRPINDGIKSTTAALEGNVSGNVKPALVSTLSSLQTQANSISSDSEAFGNGVDFVQAATLANATGQKIPYTQLALGLLIGLLVGMGLAWWRADNNRRIERPGQAADVLGTELLGEIEDLRRPVTTDADRAEILQSTREILAPVLGRIVPGSILVTSGAPGAGATVAAVGVASAAAAEGLRVAVVDGDMVTGGLSAQLGLPADGPGLVEAAGDVASDLGSLMHIVEIAPGIKVAALSYGRTTPGMPGVNAASLKAFVARLRKTFDVVVVDAPTARHDYAASVLSGIVDHVVVVVARGTLTADLDDLDKLLTSSRASVTGYVYTFAKPSRRRS